MNKIYIEQFQCPACHNMMDALEPCTAEAIPRPGDFTICDCCGHLSKYAADMHLLTVTKDDLSEWREQNPALYHEMLVLQLEIKNRNEKN